MADYAKNRTREQWLQSIASLVPNLNLGAAAYTMQFLIYRRNALSLETRLAVAK